MSQLDGFGVQSEELINIPIWKFGISSLKFTTTYSNYRFSWNSSLGNAFVYGTLLFPEVAGRVAGIKGDGEPATLFGYRRYEATTRERGNYPAIVKENTASVDGLLHRDLSEEQLEALDKFECIKDHLYKKETATVFVGDEEVTAYIYVADKGLDVELKEKMTKAWSSELFRRNDLDWYVENKL